MPKKRPENFEYLSNDPNFVPDPEIEQFMEEEIARAPKDPDMLADRLRENTAASPRDAGGDIDATWEDVNGSGEESSRATTRRPINPTPKKTRKPSALLTKTTKSWNSLTRLTAATASVLNSIRAQRRKMIRSNFVG